MADPFQMTPRQGSRLGQLLRGRRAETFASIEDLFAQAPRLRDVRPDVVWGVCATHGVDMKRRYATERQQLYRRYLEHCFRDKALSEEETADLQHLRAILHLRREEVTRIHDDVARQVYGQAVEEALVDMRLDPEEETFLRRLREELQLPEQEAARLYAERAWQARGRVLTKATSRDQDFVEHRPSAGEFTGRSDTSVEDAVADALQRAALVVPKLHWFEVVHMAGHVEEGRLTGWHVVVRAGLAAEDLTTGA